MAIDGDEMQDAVDTAASFLLLLLGFESEFCEKWIFQKSALDCGTDLGAPVEADTPTHKNSQLRQLAKNSKTSAT